MEIWKVRFEYDMFSGDQFKLSALVTDFSDEGARVFLEKRVGPTNATGFHREGELPLTRAQADQLLDILSRYDLEGYTNLPRRSAGSAPSRSLMVFFGEERYDVAWNARFPETIPPREDIMYFELFNFFNGLIYGEPGWEEVRSEDLEDPRDNPAYGERMVTQFGNRVRLVPGTGTGSEDGRGARIDYGDRLWWLEEGFTGTWEIGPEDRAWEELTHDPAVLTVDREGHVTLALNGEEWTGALPKARYYRSDVGARLSLGYSDRVFSIVPLSEDSYERVRVWVYPGPVPEEQFDPVDVTLTRQ